MQKLTTCTCFVSFALLFLQPLPAMAERTASREWTSAAGTKIQAVAQGMKEGFVGMTASDGREIKVPLASLVEADRAYLREHFKPAPPKDLPFQLGVVSGPHKADEGSTFFIYLPKSLHEGRKAPVSIYTSAGGDKKTDVEAFIDGA